MKSAESNVPKRYFFSLGYAGPRVLGSNATASAAWNGQLTAALELVARGLRARLSAHRPLAIVGSLAQGADLAIAESMLAHGAVLRAWLPEPLDRFVNDADFPDVLDRDRVAVLAQHRQLVEMRVVSTAPDRRERFAECAGHVVRDSDALLCVRHWDAAHGRGGTEESLALALAQGRPIVEVRLARDSNAEAVVVFPETWAAQSDAGVLPFPQPDPRKIVADWKSAASTEAGQSKHFIVRAAAWTVGLQLFATLFAVLTFNQPRFEVTSLLVKCAVISAAAGIAIASARHGFATRWAARRFVAELQRSWSAARGFEGAATWLEDELPVEFAEHGRDLALFHGLDRSAEWRRAARTRAEAPQPDALAADSSAPFRERYGKERIAGQRIYAEQSAFGADRGKRWLQRAFYACLAATLAALFTKLGLRAADNVAAWEGLDHACSLVSILGPTIGAALVSFVALLDLTARRETQKRLAEFLAQQGERLSTCTDWAATRQVVVATERRLLGEIKTWYARHAFRK